MSINTMVNNSGATVTIAISGRFDFGLHKEFKSAYEGVVTSTCQVNFVVDLSETDYMDSSALGMLLLLREHAGGEKSEVKIVNCRPVIREILDIANFGKLFSIQSID